MCSQTPQYGRTMQRIKHKHECINNYSRTNKVTITVPTDGERRGHTTMNPFPLDPYPKHNPFIPPDTWEEDEEE